MKTLMITTTHTEWINRTSSMSTHLGVLLEFFHSPDTNRQAGHKDYLHHTCENRILFRFRIIQGQTNNPRVTNILDIEKYLEKYYFIAKTLVYS